MLLLPAGVNLIRILLESQESALDLLMCLRILNDAVRKADVTVGARLPQLPRLLSLAAGRSALLRPILVPEGTATGRQDHVGVAQVLEECRQAQSVHPTGDDGGGLLHALPLLVIVGPRRLIVLQHECDALVRCIALHFAEAHGTHMDATGTDYTRELCVHEGGVSTLSLGARDGTMASAMVVQELSREIAACHGHSSATCDVAIDEECGVLPQGAKLRQNVFATGNHLNRVVCRNVGGKELPHTGFLDAGSHGLHHLRDALVHLAEHLVALGLVVLDEITALPEGVAGLAEGLWLQPKLRLDDRSNHQSTIRGATAEN